MNDSVPEDGEPTTFVGKTKNFCKEHKGKILAAGTTLGGVALAIGFVIARQAMEQSATTDAEDTGWVSDPAAMDEFDCDEDDSGTDGPAYFCCGMMYEDGEYICGSCGEPL